MGNVSAKTEKIMAVCIAMALCFQRLSKAAGSVFWGITIACFLYLLYKSYRSGDLRERVCAFSSYYKVIGLMLLCYLPSIIFSVDIKTSVKVFAEMWIYRFMPFYVVTLFLHDKKWLERIFAAFVIATSLDCLAAGWQVWGMNKWRGSGFTGHPLNLASLLSIVTPIVAVIIFDSQFSRKLKKVCKIALCCIFIGLIAGKGRSAWLALAIVLPLLSYRYVISSRKALVVCLAIVMLIGFGFASSQQYSKRLVSIANTTTNVSNADRIRVWQSSLKMISDYPITGVGMGNWYRIYDSGKYKLKTTVQDLPHAHNNFLQIWTETGTVGLVGFLIMTLFVLFSNFKEWLNTNNPYALMIWSSWLAFIIFGMVDFTLNHSEITKAIWFLLGMLLVLKKDAENFRIQLIS